MSSKCTFLIIIESTFGSYVEGYLTANLTLDFDLHCLFYSEALQVDRKKDISLKILLFIDKNMRQMYSKFSLLHFHVKIRHSM